MGAFVDWKPNNKSHMFSKLFCECASLYICSKLCHRLVSDEDSMDTTEMVCILWLACIGGLGCDNNGGFLHSLFIPRPSISILASSGWTAAVWTSCPAGLFVAWTWTRRLQSPERGKGLLCSFCCVFDTRQTEEILFFWTKWERIWWPDLSYFLEKLLFKSGKSQRWGCLGLGFIPCNSS